MSKDERPVVTVEARTANTCRISIKTESGEVTIHASHSEISIVANGVKVEVCP